MGTRSRVAVMHGDVCKSVYCHYDGYLEHTGKVLLKHYDSVKANQLIALGDNSGVQETIEEMRFYKDRGETDVDFQTAHSFREFLDQVQACFAEYYYVMRDGVWYAGCVYETEGLIKGGLVPLDEAIADVLLKEAIAEDE
jgi:hypothetical protein